MPSPTFTRSAARSQKAEMSRAHPLLSVLVVVSLGSLALVGCAPRPDPGPVQGGAPPTVPAPAPDTGSPSGNETSEPTQVSAPVELSIDGLWRSDGGWVIALQGGQASASLFGFDGGPDGSYQLSRSQSDGTYVLYGSHITGGTVEYRVEVQDADRITLTLVKESSFAAKHLALTRQ